MKKDGNFAFFLGGGGRWALACAITTTTETSTTYKCCPFKTPDFVFKTPACFAISFELGILSHKVFSLLSEIIICSFNNNELRNVPMAKLFISCTGQCPVFRNNYSFKIDLQVYGKKKAPSAKISLKYVNWHALGKISIEFHGISHVFVNFAGFRGFTLILRLCDRAKFQKPCAAGR